MAGKARRPPEAADRRSREVLIVLASYYNRFGRPPCLSETRDLLVGLFADRLSVRLVRHYLDRLEDRGLAYRIPGKGKDRQWLAVGWL